MSFGVNTSNLSNGHENYEAGTQPKVQTKQFINHVQAYNGASFGQSRLSSVLTAAFPSKAEEPPKEEQKTFINSVFTPSAYMN